MCVWRLSCDPYDRSADNAQVTRSRFNFMSMGPFSLIFSLFGPLFAPNDDQSKAKEAITSMRFFRVLWRVGSRFLMSGLFRLAFQAMLKGVIARG